MRGRVTSEGDGTWREIDGGGKSVWVDGGSESWLAALLCRYRTCSSVERGGHDSGLCVGLGGWLVW
jgi:hypothetical protein